ncbi:DUF882 domain-containing protein [Pelagibacterium halotolerans]|uniref:DUF882 domain-containing protein n=1 Tax=Pelagibacterium halotolerans TaxID=531813 RepID=UPI0038513C21
MAYRGIEFYERMMRMVLACLLALTAILPTTVPANAASERTLYLYYTHTKETARITFKRNGRYVQSGLDQLNWFLRDWRRNEPTEMDPALFDIIWEVYQATGSDQPVHVVSAYRAPETNAMLAARSSAVAKNSNHMRGMAMDFYIPGVPVSKIRELGFRIQGGGVGYYPNSNSPFVHLDTGSVRAWPRMTTAQLRQIFPDGRTLHVPSNGNVLSQEGRAWAQAQYSQCHRVPCGSGSNLTGGSGSDTQVADNRPTRTLMDLFTGEGNSNEQQASQPTQVASAPTQRSVNSVPVTPAPPPASSAPIALASLPPERPAALSTATAAAEAAPQNIPFEVREGTAAGATQVAELITEAQAPVPPSLSRDLAQLRTATPSAVEGGNEGTLAIAALEANAPEPQPRPDFAPAVVASAYAPTASATTNLVDGERAQSAPAPIMRPALSETPLPQDILTPDRIETAGINPQMGLESFADLFEGPILPIDGKPDEATANALASLTTRPGELYAPDIGHVTETLLTPVAVASAHYGFMTEPDNADFDPSTQPGNTALDTGFSPTTALGVGMSSFGTMPSILVTLPR